MKPNEFRPRDARVRTPREGDHGFVGPSVPRGWKPDSDKSRLSGGKVVGSLFSIILVTLLAVAVIRILSGRQIVTFTALFQQLSKAPTIPTNWLKVLSTNFGDTFPYGFQWLGSIIDFFSDILSFSLYTGTAALNALSFFFYFLKWVFL